MLPLIQWLLVMMIMTIMMMIGADIAQTGAESRHSRDNYRAGGWGCLQPAPDVPLTEGHTIIGVMRSHHLFISPHLNIPPLTSAEAQHRALHQEERQPAAA